MQAALGAGGSTVFSVHPMCGPPAIYTTLGGSPNVLINGQPAYRVTDLPIVHPTGIPPGCGAEALPLVLGSPNVFANGLAIGRVGDAHGCGGLILTGSANVLVN